MGSDQKIYLKWAPWYTLLQFNACLLQKNRIKKARYVHSSEVQFYKSSNNLRLIIEILCPKFPKHILKEEERISTQTDRPFVNGLSVLRFFLCKHRKANTLRMLYYLAFIVCCACGKLKMINSESYDDNVMTYTLCLLQNIPQWNDSFVYTLYFFW